MPSIKYYVYFLKDEDTIFYVGKGSKNRLYDHRRDAIRTQKRHPVLDKIRKMLSENRDVVYEKVFFTDIEKEAYKKEIALISDIGLENLKNITKGGEGATYEFLTEEHKRNIGKSVSALWQSGHLTKEKCPGDRDNPSDAFKFSQSGKRNSEETRRRKAEAQKQIWRTGNRTISEDGRIRQSQGGKQGGKFHKGKPKSPEHRKKISAAVRLAKHKAREKARQTPANAVE